MSWAEQLTAPHAHHGEGPVWWDGWNGLRWVDMLAGDVLRLHDNGTVSREHVGTVAAALRPRRSGGYVVATERGFALVAGDGAVRDLGEVWSSNGVRMNDGGCDPDGRFYCGSMAYDMTPGRGALHRLDPDLSVRTVLTGVSVSNGLAWSPDGGTAYYIDTGTQRIDAFDYGKRTGLTGRRPVVQVAEEDGAPDGLTVDAEGSIWVALYGGSQVRRYRPDGTHDGTVRVPVRNVTACTFGGPGLAELFITTSAQDTDEPEAGAVFRASVGVRGTPALCFDA